MFWETDLLSTPLFLLLILSNSTPMQSHLPLLTISPNILPYPTTITYFISSSKFNAPFITPPKINLISSDSTPNLFNSYFVQPTSKSSMVPGDIISKLLHLNPWEWLPKTIHPAMTGWRLLAAMWCTNAPWPNPVPSPGSGFRTLIWAVKFFHGRWSNLRQPLLYIQEVSLALRAPELWSQLKQRGHQHSRPL